MLNLIFGFAYSLAASAKNLSLEGILDPKFEIFVVVYDFRRCSVLSCLATHESTSIQNLLY